MFRRGWFGWGRWGSGRGQYLSFLPVVPLAAPLVVGLRPGTLSASCRIPGPISWGGRAALLLACQALSVVVGHRVARELPNLGRGGSENG